MDTSPAPQTGTSTPQTPLDRFNQQHADQPSETWPAIDYEIYENLHLTA